MTASERIRAAREPRPISITYVGSHPEYAQALLAWSEALKDERVSFEVFSEREEELCATAAAVRTARGSEREEKDDAELLV